MPRSHQATFRPLIISATANEQSTHTPHCVIPPKNLPMLSNYQTSAVFDYRYRYRDISPYWIISISTPVISKLSIWRRTIQPAVRLDERVSRWFNLTGGQRRVNYLARQRQRTAGSRGRQSPIVGVRGGGILLAREPCAGKAINLQVRLQSLLPVLR